jgi:serine-type D-Ala-D-Ala carboxypeptidase (penicillin-binding protein 5/6)
VSARVAGVIAAAALAAGALAPATAGAAASKPAFTDPPHVQAPEAILIEPATGDVVFSRHPFTERPIASTTKMMTALVTIGHASLHRTFTAIPYAAQPAESVIGLQAGERMKVSDLVRGLLVASANDAAATLAVNVAGSRKKFVKLMNAEAKKLGLTHTHYANPVGLDESGNHSSVSDLVKLALVLRSHPFLRHTVNMGHVTLLSGSHPRTLTNVNDLLNKVSYVNGVKTGHTQDAGYCLVGSATRHGITVVSAVLGDPSEAARDSDTLALLRYGLAQYHIIHPVKKGTIFAHAALTDRSATTALVAAKTVGRTAARSEKLTTTVVGAPATINGPLPAGAQVGTIEVRQRGRVVARVPLVTREAIAAPTLRQKVSFWARHHKGLLIGGAAALLACTVCLVIWRRRRRARRSGRRARETTGIA